MNTLGLLVVYIVAFSSLVGAAVHFANDHPVLFNFISNAPTSWSSVDNTGNNIVDNGDSVVVGVGTFSGSPYADSYTVYYTNRIYFSLVCSGAVHSCVLDGLNSRRLINIRGTGGDTLTLSGIHFLDGGTSNIYGGALCIRFSALVSVQGCKLSSNQARSGGGIYAENIGTTVHLYSTSFDGNTADNGDDIYVFHSGCSVTVHTICPPDWSGTPAAGSDLDTYANFIATLSGTTKSFDIG